MAIPKVKGLETEWGTAIEFRHNGKLRQAPSKYEQRELMIDAIKRYLNVSERLQGSISEIENIDRILTADLLPRLQGQRPRPRFFSVHHNLLSNGGRLYIDGPNLEYSTPECLSARTLVAADKAGEAIANLARLSINGVLAAEGKKMIISKDISDRKGSSAGCHENYLLTREAFNRLMERSLDIGYWASFLVCRIIFTGAGKIGTEIEERGSAGSLYQISQRADFISHLISGDTITRRGLINTRDEPLADHSRFARFHVIAGDANLMEIAAYMKAGIASIILKTIEDKFLSSSLIIEDPVRGIKLSSRDLTCLKPVLKMMDGRRFSSLDLSEAFFEQAAAYSKVVEFSLEDKDLMRLWEETNSDFRTGNNKRLSRRVDWKLKQLIFNDFLEGNNITAPWNSLEKYAMQDGFFAMDQLRDRDIIYHNIDPKEGFYALYKEAGEVEQLIPKEEITALVKNPPEECRSYFRGRCLAKFGKDIDFVDWDEISFMDHKEHSYENFRLLHRPPIIILGNPFWGGKSQTEAILDKAENYRDLVESLRKISDQEA